MDNQYIGMTVNELLYVAGLMEKFDNAIAEQNIYKAILILKQVDITDDNLIAAILEQLDLIKKL